MAYWDVSQLAIDQDFSQRTIAAVAQEDWDGVNPVTWQYDNRWGMAGTPGFGDAYASAVAGGVEFPGRDASVISDGQILSAIQALHAEEEAEEAPGSSGSN